MPATLKYCIDSESIVPALQSAVAAKHQTIGVPGTTYCVIVPVLEALSAWCEVIMTAHLTKSRSDNELTRDVVQFFAPYAADYYYNPIQFASYFASYTQAIRDFYPDTENVDHLAVASIVSAAIEAVSAE